MSRCNTTCVLAAALLALTLLALRPLDAHAESPLVGLTQAIVGGQSVSDAPVLVLRGPTGRCTAGLVAPNLVATARHCVASLEVGAFTCTPQGETVFNGTPGGRMGADWPADELTFYTATHADDSDVGSPDARGKQTLSTGTQTLCRDDLAFVVLDRPIAGMTIPSVRLEDSTLLGDRLQVFGYGLTGVPGAPVSLHMRDDVKVLGVGALKAPPYAGLAPVRAVRISAVTCPGDSGGPILSYDTGALIAVVSLGAYRSGGEADDPFGPACAFDELSAASGPRISAYADLTRLAFAAAGLEPTPETGPVADAGSEPAADAGTDPVPKPSDRDSGCSVSAAPRSSAPPAPLWIALLVASWTFCTRLKRGRPGR